MPRRLRKTVSRTPSIGSPKVTAKLPSAKKTSKRHLKPVAPGEVRKRVFAKLGVKPSKGLSKRISKRPRRR